MPVYLFCSAESVSYVYQLPLQGPFPLNPLRWLVLDTLFSVHQTHTFQNTDITCTWLRPQELCILSCNDPPMSR